MDSRYLSLAFSILVVTSMNFNLCKTKRNIQQTKHPDIATRKMLQKLHHKTITNGWDVVFLARSEEINKLFQKKYYHQRLSDDKQHKLAKTIELDPVKIIRPLITMTDQYNFTVGPPIFKFIPNESNSVMMKMDILEGNTTQTTTYNITGFKLPPKIETQRLNYSNSSQPKLIAKFKLHRVLGIVKFATVKKLVGKVSLTFKTSDFVFENLAFSADLDLNLVAKLKQYFRTKVHEDAYTLGSIVYDKANIPEALWPKTFHFKLWTQKTSTNGILVLFITTHSKHSNQPEVNQLQHVLNPLPSSFTGALIVSNRIVFRDLVYPSFSKKIPQLTLETDSHGTIQGMKGTDTHLDAGLYVVKEGWKGRTIFQNHITDHYPRIRIPLIDFRISFTDLGQMKLSWVTTWQQMMSYYTGYRLQIMHPRIHLNITKVFELHINRRGKITFPRIRIPSDKVNLTILDLPPSQREDVGTGCFNGFVFYNCPKPASQFSNNWNFLSSKIKNKIHNSLKKIKININPVSVFAVSNLLMPNAQVLNMREVYLPGDLVCYGDISKEYKPIKT